MLDLRPDNRISNENNIEAHFNPDHNIKVAFQNHKDKGISQPIKTAITEPSGKSIITYHNSIEEAKTHAFHNIKNLMGIE